MIRRPLALVTAVLVTGLLTFSVGRTLWADKQCAPPPGCWVYHGETSCAAESSIPWESDPTKCTDFSNCSGLTQPLTCEKAGVFLEQWFPSETDWYRVRKKAQEVAENGKEIVNCDINFLCYNKLPCAQDCDGPHPEWPWWRCKPSYVHQADFLYVDDYVLGTECINQP